MAANFNIARRSFMPRDCQDIWQNCYDSGWQAEIVPEAFAHPAKFSRALIRRIYDHAFAEGWLVPGMAVIDPFAGVGLGALDAMWKGLNWVGCELEPKFYALAEKNIELWHRKYKSKEGFGSARIIQGDSRKLAEVIEGADCCIGSPPYAESIGTKDQKFWDNHNDRLRNWRGATRVIQDYGSSPGQLASLPEGRFEAVIGSPSFENSLANDKRNSERSLVKQLEKKYHRKFTDRSFQPVELTENGNIGNSSGPTFWSAAREILVQCHMILKPGGHAIWVCKDFIRKGRRVSFSDQWQALCESVGFRLVCCHKAMLVKNHGEQETIWDGTKELKTERKGFFRKLCEKKGSPRIDWEDVICLSKIPRRIYVQT